MNMSKLIVYIGRFQPFHNGHFRTLEQALSLGQRVLVLVGSANSSKSLKNPFGFEERKEMILGAFDENERIKISIKPLDDYLYDDAAWLKKVYELAHEEIPNLKNSDISIIGYEKDISSYYLKEFPHWKFISAEEVNSINATNIRNLLFQSDKGSWEDNRLSVEHNIKDLVPDNVSKQLSAYCKTNEFITMRNEWEYINQYKKSWEEAPYPPTFVTTDAVVKCQENVLLITRKYEPGKKLLALPGGFINQNETLLEGCKRELFEETGLNLDQIAHLSTGQKVFDLPSRSLRGRTITHAFSFQLDKFPNVEAGDDAETFEWVPIKDLQASKFYEDHYFIIKSVI